MFTIIGFVLALVSFPIFAKSRSRSWQEFVFGVGSVAALIIIICVWIELLRRLAVWVWYNAP